MITVNEYLKQAHEKLVDNLSIQKGFRAAQMKQHQNEMASLDQSIKDIEDGIASFEAAIKTHQNYAPECQVADVVQLPQERTQNYAAYF